MEKDLCEKKSRIELIVYLFSTIVMMSLLVSLSQLSIMLFSLSFGEFSDFFFFFFLRRHPYFFPLLVMMNYHQFLSPTSACTRGLTKKVFFAIVTRHFIYLIIEMFHRISSRLVRKKHNFFFLIVLSLELLIKRRAQACILSLSLGDMSAEIEHGWNNNHRRNGRKKKKKKIPENSFPSFASVSNEQNRLREDIRRGQRG